MVTQSLIERKPEDPASQAEINQENMCAFSLNWMALVLYNFSHFYDYIICTSAYRIFFSRGFIRESSFYRRLRTNQGSKVLRDFVSSVRMQRLEASMAAAAVDTDSG